LLLFVCCVFFFTLQEEEKKGPDDSAVITDAEFFRYISFLFKFQINFFFLFYLSQRQAFSFSQRHVIDQIYFVSEPFENSIARKCDKTKRSYNMRVWERLDSNDKPGKNKMDGIISIHFLSLRLIDFYYPPKSFPFFIGVEEKQSIDR
jgi:hypothetical protein